MLYTDQTCMPRHAPVDEFKLLDRRLLCGKRLRDIQALQESIVRYGLLAPIIAMETAGQLLVLDGRKRLAAVRRLAFEGRLPRSLSRVPYRLSLDLRTTDRHIPILIYNRDLYAAVLQQFQTGASITALAAQFYISHQCVRDILSLSRLHPSIRQAVFQRVIDFSQAQAYAAIPDQNDQLARLRRLSPFATPAQIFDDPSDQIQERIAVAA